jgi:hypothetical protein
MLKVRVQDGANTIKQAMKYAINTKSSIEEYEEYEGENAPKKRASQEATNTASLIFLTKHCCPPLTFKYRRSRQLYKHWRKESADHRNLSPIMLKSVLEEFETFQSVSPFNIDNAKYRMNN